MKMHRSDKVITAFILIFVVAGIYTYFSQRPIIRDELLMVSGELSETPELIEHGEGLQYYAIRWKLKGNDRLFYLRDCALEKANTDSILNLSPSTAVKMLVKESEYKNDEEINVFSLQVKNEYLLMLDDFNQCYANYWKRLLPLIILIVGLLLYSVYFLNKRNVRLKKFG